MKRNGHTFICPECQRWVVDTLTSATAPPAPTSHCGQYSILDVLRKCDAFIGGSMNCGPDGLGLQIAVQEKIVELEAAPSTPMDVTKVVALAAWVNPNDVSVLQESL
jgi:hypothetical protein